MDVLQKEIDEVYATHPTAHEALDNRIVEQHQQFVRSLTEVNGGCAVSFRSFEPEKLRYCPSVGAFPGTYSRRGRFKRN